MIESYLARAFAARNVRIGLFMSAGVMAAAQIGKTIISIPLIRAEMDLGLDLAGLIVGIFAILGASFGIGAGISVQRLGPRKSLVGGMACIALGNVIGGSAPNEWLLLCARLVEGLGFLGVVLVVPGLLAVSVERERRDFVMALWSAYMPTGITLAMMTAPLVSLLGWRPLWFMSACIAALFCVVLHVAVPDAPAFPQRRHAGWTEEIATVIKNPTCIVLALAFFAFSCQIFSMTFALPLVLTSQHGISVGNAGLLSAAMLTVAAAGHVCSSFLLRAGVPIWANIAAAFLLFGLAPFVVYSAATPLLSTLIFAALALGIGGLAPGALYAAAPGAAPHTGLIPSTIGMLQQASNLGQFTGPFALGLWVQHFGWSAAPAILAPLASLGLVAALIVRWLLGSRGSRLSNDSVR